MTKRERMIAALSHRETDFIPYDIGFTKEAFDKLAAFYGNDNFAEKIGNHMMGHYYSGGLTPMPDREGYVIDDFGVIWNRTVDKDIGVVENVQIPGPEWGMYKFPHVPDDELRKGCEWLMANNSEHFACGSLGFSLFERAWTLMGMENLLMFMITDPDFVEDLFDKIVEFNMQIINIFLEYDIDCVYFGDDWGQQSGLIMGPAMWRKFIKPNLAKMYGAVKAKGKFVVQHSCGDIQEVYPDLIEIGLDAHQTFQPELFDIADIKKRYAGKLAFWGGISTQRLLPFETPKGVVKKAIEVMKIMRPGGGFIVAPTHAVPGDVPPENMDALIKLFQNQAAYLT